MRVSQLNPKTKAWGSLALAALLHVGVVLTLYLAGQFKIFPATFDSNGIGISFALDSRFYHIEATQMAHLLRGHQFGDWWAFNAQPHVKLYSLSFAGFGPLVGFNIISAEPVNLVLYLLIVTVAYLIGRELFGPRSGLFAAGLVAVWPSFLLHTTQMLRDPVYILSLLLFVLVFVVALTRILSLSHALLIAITGVCACVLLWLTRGDTWELVFLMLLTGILMLIARQLLTRHFFWGNTLVGLILLSAGLLIPRIIPTYRQQDSALQPTIGVRASPTDPPGALPEAVFGHAEPTSNTHLSKLSRRVGVLRHKFIIQYPLAGSNIDTHVELTGLRDVIFYMPRATQIGLFSPFPHMWFTRGAQVGLQGRLWAGVETLWMYAMTVLAIVCVVRNWRKYSVCLTSLLIVLGCTALGYVVVNIATLYRMRYGFWILLMILGARGLLDITIRRARSSRDCQKQDPLANA